MYMTTVSCTYFCLDDAYLSVRTEPLSDIGQTGGKKNTSTWTMEDKRKLRTLKSDEKSRFSWRVISTKMGKTESDVRAMWNQIKDTCG